MKPAPARRRLAAAALLVTLGAAIPAYAARYWTPREVLASFFADLPETAHVSYKSVTLTDAQAAEIAKQIGAAQVAKQWTVYVAVDQDKRKGFAIVQDHERGMHEPIDFAVRFDPAGAVLRVEIMEYREPYGEEVREERFRKQFVGKTARDAITAGKDIDIISGASISSKSIAVGVKRDVLVLDAALKSGAL